MKEKTEPRGYKDEYYPPVPTGGTKFWRSFIVWQFYKVWRVNYKIMKIVVKGHS